jgi:hypothetical protein
MALTAAQITGLNNMNVYAQRAALGTLVSRTSGTAQTVTSTTPGTIRASQGSIVGSATGIQSGNLVGARGDCTLSGTVTGGAFLYGSQGKLIVTGTMNHADSRLCGSLAQLDISAGTYTTGQLSALWVDAGATASSSAISTKGGGQFNLIRAQNTTAATCNAIIYGYGKADYALDLSDNSAGWLDAGSGASANCTGHIKIKINGVDGYLRVYQTAS